MLRIQWNTLKVGDAVYVHDSNGDLRAGVVAMVGDPDSEPDTNEVAVRIEDLDECSYVWPSLADVHTDPVEVSESCVHCRLLRL